MRVTGGLLGGRRLGAPPPGVRPTADRVREALFARLGDLEDAIVLDLYAGTGALGIEALSRGAERAVFVERSAPGVAALRRNLERLELSARSRIVRTDVRAALRRLSREELRFDLVFADPPYAAPDVAESLSGIASGGLLAPGGTVVVERGRRHPLAAIEGLAPVESRRYGDTVVVWLESSAEARGPAGRGDPEAARGAKGPRSAPGARAGRAAGGAKGDPET